MRWVLRMLMPVFSTEVLDKERTGLKILQVIRSVDPQGGGPIEGMIQQGEEMRAAGHDIETLTLDAPASPSDARLSDNNIHFLGPAFLGYGYTHRLAPWLRKHGPGYDVIVVHGMWQYHGYCVARVARQLGLPYVIFLHGMLDPWFAREYPLKHLKKWLYWPWAEYRVLRDARYVLFTTAEELRLARESFWLYKARERLVGYGIKGRDIPIGSAREAFFSTYPELRGKRILRAVDFSGETLITYPVPEDRIDMIRDVLKPAKVPFKRRTAELTIAILQLVASKRGLAALPNWGLKNYIEQDYIIAKRIGRSRSWAKGRFIRFFAPVAYRSDHKPPRPMRLAMM